MDVSEVKPSVFLLVNLYGRFGSGILAFLLLDICGRFGSGIPSLSPCKYVWTFRK